jgi:four helix bundle protein
MTDRINSYKELRVFQNAMEMALEVYKLTKDFPAEEKYSLVDQMRRSSRSVCANIAEAWRKRRYMKAFVAKLNDCEGEACETQVWIEIAVRCGYLSKDVAAKIDEGYETILAQLVNMIRGADKWLIK